MKTTNALLLLVIVFLCAAVGWEKSVLASATYTNNVNGSLAAPAPGVINPLYLELDVVGDTTGTFEAAIQHNNTRHIVGGEWTHAAITHNADGSIAVAGTLTGTFNSGLVEVNDDGSASSVKGATLVIESASGIYSTATSGGGSLDGTFADGPTPTFSGTLSFSF